MPIGTGIIYNVGDLILSQVSGSGTAFLETKIAAATSSIVYFDSTARINSASLNSITVGTASYVSGSTSIITNLTASNISASGTSSFGYVGIGTNSPIYKLDVQPTSSTARLGNAIIGAWPVNTTFALFGHNNLDHTTSATNYALIQWNDGTTYLNASSGKNINFRIANSDKMILNSSGQFGIGTTSPIAGFLDVRSIVTKSVAGPTNIAFFGSSDGGNPLGLVVNHESSSGVKMVGLVGTEYGLSGNNIKINETLHVQYSGNVGIGAINPNSKLTIYGSPSLDNTFTYLMNLLNTDSTITAGMGSGISFGSNITSGGGNPIAHLCGIIGIKENATSGNYAGALTFWTRINGAASAERLRIDSSGSVGIGTSSPAYKLDVIGPATSNGVTLRLSDAASLANSRHILLTRGSVSGSIGIAGSQIEDPLWLSRSSGYDLIVASSGNVGVGTTSPAAKLEISSSTAASLLNVKGAGGNGLLFVSGSGNVGIGIGSPIAPLDVQSNTGGTGIIIRGRSDNSTALRFYANNGTTQQLYIGTDDSNIDFDSVSTRPIRFFVNDLLQYQISQLGVFSWKDGAGGDRMRLNSTGLGIGTTSPTAKLVVMGDDVQNYAKSSVPTAIIADDDVEFLIGSTDNFAGEEITLRMGSVLSSYYTYGAYVKAIQGAGVDYYKLAFGTSNGAVATTKMTIDNVGNVGIGTTTANHLLHLSTVTTDVSIGLYTTNANASARNWLISANEVAYGDFNIKQSNAIGGNPRSAGTSRFYIQNDGNVGIGTTSPTANLTVYNSSTPTIDFNTGAGTSRGRISATSSDLTIAALTSSPLVFKIDTSEKVRIASDGNVGIGTTSPAYLLDVSGSSRHGYRAVDTHQFTGSVSVSGSVTAASFTGSLSGSITSALTASYLTPANSYTITNLTASNISASLTGSFGMVGIGTISPGYTLEVNGTQRVVGNFYLFNTVVNPASNYANQRGVGFEASTGKLEVAASASNALSIGRFGSTGQILDFRYAGTQIGYFSLDTNDLTLGTARHLILSPTGNVGIGTTTVSRKLHAYVTTGPVMRLQSSGSNASIEFIPSSGHNRYNWLIGAQQNISDAFEITPSTATNGTTFSTPAVLVKSDGNVGIGTTSPGALLEVSSSTAASLLNIKGAGGNAILFVSGSGNVGIGTTSPGARLEISGSSNSVLLNIKSPISGAILYVSGSGAVGIGTSNVGAYTLQVSGSFAATTKSFVIEHPTKAGKKLIYGSLESPYHGIRLTGKDTLVNGKCKVNLPDYIYKLILHDSVNIQLTGIKCGKTLYIDDINVPENYFVVAYDKSLLEFNKTYDFFWDFTAIRSDVPELQTEM